MRKKRNTPINEIILCGRQVVVGDSSPRAVPLATHRQYDMTLASIKMSGELEEVAATRTLGLWKRVRLALRPFLGVYGGR